MSELRDRRAALERRFLRPDRVPLDPDIASAPTGPATWARAIALGRLPASFADDPQRRFRASRRVAFEFPELRDRLSYGLGEGAEFLAPVPCERQAARLLCSDPAGMLEAEVHARVLFDALVGFGLDARPRVIAWRISGCAIERPEAGGPPLGELATTVAWLRELMQRLTGRSLDPPHAHRRFEHVRELLEWSHRRARALDLRVPADLGPLAGKRLGELPDPFTPWLRVIETGYWLLAASRRTIELAAPFPAPDRPRLDKRGRPDIKRRSRPRVVWSDTLDRLRLACMRGDVGAYATLRAACADTREPGGTPLIHYGVFGGLAPLDAMLADDPQLDVDARDAEGRTPLMLAAGWPRGGPLGSSWRGGPVPLGHPRGDAIAGICRWLLDHGAERDAVDLRGWTALHWACCEGRADAIARLVALGFRLEALDAMGRTPLHVALSRAPAQASHPWIASVEALLAQGADADARDDRGWTGLHYLASSNFGQREITELARLLRKHGAQPNRDRLGHSPATLRDGPSLRDPAFHASTPVAAGPGAWPAPPHAREQERALLENPDRLPLEALAVWADWLQSHGDPRGELVAAHVQAASIGRKRRRSAATDLERARLRIVPIGTQILCTIGHGEETQPGRWSTTHALYRHGLLVRVDVYPRSASELHTLATLAEHEPLLSDLRLHCELMPLSLVLDELRTHASFAGVRRLVLAGLPAELPALDHLATTFTRVRELRLIGAGKLDRLSLAWPGLERLRLRHGDTSEWTRGGSHVELELPDLRELDLALPVGARTSEQELAGFRRLLTQLGPSLTTLRLSPVAAETISALLDHPPPSLRTLLLDRTRGQALEQLALRIVPTCPTWLRKLDALELGVTELVREQRAIELATIRAMVPVARLRP
jgi:uncharacterized protein (TIGR02996 family)